MNSPAWVPWLIGGMAVALAVVSALAGALWARARSVPLWQVAQLARELAERQRALEELVLRLERGTRAKTRGSGGIRLSGSEGVSPLSPTLSHEGGGGQNVEGMGEIEGRSLPPTPVLPLKGGGGQNVGRIDGVEPTASVAPRRDGAHPTPPGPTLIAVPDLATAASREAQPAVSDELQRRHGTVWELADAGARADQIATHLGLPIGHVELILGLRKPLATSGGNR